MMRRLLSVTSLASVIPHYERFGLSVSNVWAVWFRRSPIVRQNGVLCIGSAWENCPRTDKNNNWGTKMGNKRRGKEKAPPFVTLEYRVINVNAFTQMRHSSRGLLPYFLAKARYRHNDEDIYEKTIEFTYREAERYGYSSSTYYAAVEQLRKHGFIDKVRQGGSHGEYKASNLYRLSQRWQKYGSDEFVESDQYALNEHIQKRVQAGYI